jgi:hypothetical protein
MSLKRVVHEWSNVAGSYFTWIQEGETAWRVEFLVPISTMSCAASHCWRGSIADTNQCTRCQSGRFDERIYIYIYDYICITRKNSNGGLRIVAAPSSPPSGPTCERLSIADYSAEGRRNQRALSLIEISYKMMHAWNSAARHRHQPRARSLRMKHVPINRIICPGYACVPYECTAGRRRPMTWPSIGTYLKSP